MNLIALLVLSGILPLPIYSFPPVYFNGSIAGTVATTGDPLPQLLYVSPDGNDRNDGTSRVTALQHVQTAIDRVADSGLIVLTEGVYSESLTLDHPVRITGEAGVILDGNADFRVITNMSDGSALSNLTIRRGTSFDGAGIYNTGSLRLTNVTVRDCRAIILLFDTHGAGIYNNGTLEMVNCTVAGNRSEPFGTVVGGNQKGLGGGIYQAAGELSLSFTTVAGNVAAVHSTAGNGVPAGGGLYVAGGTASLWHTIIAGNRTEIASTGEGPLDGPDCYGAISHEGFNLVSNSTDCGIIGVGDGLQVEVDPVFDPAGLQDNGGIVPTVALMPGSPAIDAGDPVCVLSTDARGFVRPMDGNVDEDFICDIGAFEFASTYPGDVDGDGYLTLHDYSGIAECMTGPGVPAVPFTCAPVDVIVADIVQDSVIDLKDVYRFEQFRSLQN